MVSNLNRQLPPWVSKGALNRAGDAIRSGRREPSDVATINKWREAHYVVLNSFQPLLRNKAKVLNLDVKVAQRHKRRNTIFDKLHRLPDMHLANMQDVAGLRLIFRSLEDLHNYRAKMHTARFKHERKNINDKFDYISRPKSTGYRGIHDVYKYHSQNPKSLYCKELLVEIQYRTLVQHAWATANEVIGYITPNQPKFERGDQKHIEAMRLASEILARAHEPECPQSLKISDQELLRQFEHIDSQIKILPLLRTLKYVSADMSQNKLNMIIIYNNYQSIEIRPYQKIGDAMKALFQLEEQFPEKDMVLVKAKTTDEIRLAFKNYFTDASDFVDLMHTAMERLRTGLA